MTDISPVVSAIIAFIATAVSGLYALPVLKKLNFGQTIREEGPQWHQKKQGTPTMGGIMMIFGVLVALCVAFAYGMIAKVNIFSEVKTNKFTIFIASLGLALLMGVVGFLDDYIKVVKKRNLGLTARQKTVMQLFLSALYLAVLYFAGVKTTWLPFIGNVSIVSGAGLLFWPIALMFIYGFINAVNLTDGVDGLASSVTLIVCCIFMLITGGLRLAGANMFASAVAGTCVGFLVWNSHPAKMFMGDTGSLFLGGAVVGLAFCTGRPILLLLIGIVYLCEALSVVIQVAYFKKTRKRIFKMTPIHHHFEMSGWGEEKIVLIFSVVSMAFGAIAVLISGLL